MSVNPSILTSLSWFLRSRKVLTALSALIVGLAVTQFPELDAVREPMLSLVGALALAIIGGISWEDAAKSAAGSAKEPPQDVRELARLAAVAAIESYFASQPVTTTAPVVTPTLADAPLTITVSGATTQPVNLTPLE